MRTAKACGPDALVAGVKPVGRDSAGDGDNQAGLAGESTQEPVNTIAQGMSVDPAEPVVTAACVFCCRRAMGEVVTRHSLRPLSFKGDTSMHNSDNHVAGMRSHTFLAV